jgi:hypothetical protein
MKTPHVKLIPQSPVRLGLPRKQQLPRAQAMWIIRGFLLIPLVVGCFALSPAALAVTPARDGGYPNQNTAEDEDALFSLTTGTDDTAMGFDALDSNTTGSDNALASYERSRFPVREEGQVAWLGSPNRLSATAEFQMHGRPSSLKLCPAHFGILKKDTWMFM